MRVRWKEFVELDMLQKDYRLHSLFDVVVRFFFSPLACAGFTLFLSCFCMFAFDV